MKIDLRAVGLRLLQKRFAKVKQVRRGLMKDALLLLMREWKLQLSRGRSSKTLGVVTGYLRRSVQLGEIGEAGGSVIMRAIYGRIHEFGGVIIPVRAQWLLFKTRSGNWVRTKKVVMPKRPHRAPAIEAAIGKLEIRARERFEGAFRREVARGLS